jgi:hypothetical protein
MSLTTVKRGIIAAMIFIADLKSLIQDTGQQIDWTVLGPSFRRGAFKVKLAEDVSIGETAVNVDALEASLKKGQEIDFGTVVDVLVTIAASALAAATSVTVTALPGPLPSGAVIDLGTNKFIRLTANAAAGATTLAVSAIPTALAGGETGTYHGGDKVLKLAADAVLGATTITVEPPNFFIADDSEGYGQLPGYGEAGYTVPAGTIMARNATNHKLFPRSLVTGAETAECILLTDAKSDSNTDSLTGYGVTYGGSIFENLLPDAVVATGLIPSGYKTELGARFVWKVSRDNRDS